MVAAMSIRACFTGKVASGRVSQRAGQQLLGWLREAEADAATKAKASRRTAHVAAQDVVDAAAQQAARKADLARRSALKQADILRAAKTYEDLLNGLRARGKAPAWVAGWRDRMAGGQSTSLYAAMRSLLARDPHEIADWGSAFYRERQLRGEAHGRFAAGLARLRPKRLGLKRETAAELDTLRALWGDPRASADAQAVAKAWGETAEELRLAFVDAGGALPQRPDWRLPNPSITTEAVRVVGRDGFKALVRANVDRAAMLDFATGQPLTDLKFERLLDEAAENFWNGHLAEGGPSAAVKGSPMLANSRAASRFFVWKSPEAWLEIADKLGGGGRPFDTMIQHIEAMSHDIAMMETFGPNPEATKRFIKDLFAREGGRLAATAAERGTKVKDAALTARRLESQVKADEKRFDNLWAEVTRQNRVPVDMQLAQIAGDSRSLLVSVQMGSAIVSSLSDVWTTVMASRFVGLPATRVLARAASDMFRPGAEIHAAQMGMIADTLAHGLGQTDRIMGDTIRSGVAAGLGTAVIRASGIRRWSATIRNAFGLEYMAHVARSADLAWPQLGRDMREGLTRHGIDAAAWDLIRAATPTEPRPNAFFIRPEDVASGGTPEHVAASRRYGQLLHKEMDYAVIESDPVARATLIGDSKPGTGVGELRRAGGMYRSFAASFVSLHISRMFSRGFNWNSRMAHGAATFIGMTLFGMMSLQAKQLLAGRDPREMDAAAWGAAALQGGGLGIFGDFLFADRSRYGAGFATTLAGPQLAFVDAVVGDFIIGNLQKAARGEFDINEFFGDAAYLAGRYMPGSSLWYLRLAWNRAIVDQLALALDPDASARFRRLERAAERETGQGYWWRLGQSTPSRAPAFGGGA